MTRVARFSIVRDKNGQALGCIKSRTALLSQRMPPSCRLSLSLSLSIRAEPTHTYKGAAGRLRVINVVSSASSALPLIP